MDLYPDKVVVGLTGGIASGKTLALGFFEKHGWNAISTDKLVSNILEKDKIVIDAIQGRWGLDQGNIDKSKIAQLIFNHPKERSWLENLIHPIVRAKWVSLIQQSSFRHHVVEIPLLFEKKLCSHFYKTISVFAPVTIQISRLISRGLSPEEANSRLEAQASNKEKAALADYVLLGNGSPGFCKSQVLSLVRKF